MQGKRMASRVYLPDEVVETPNGEGVVAGSMDDPKLGHLVVVDHGARGEGGVVRTVAYPVELVEEVEHD